MLAVRKKLVTRFDVSRVSLEPGFRPRTYRRGHIVSTSRPARPCLWWSESGCRNPPPERTIVRLTDARSGAIRVSSADILALRGRALNALRRDVQMIFKDPFAPVWCPHEGRGRDRRATAGARSGQPRRCPRHKVALLLRQVGLEPAMASRYPHEFSGGQGSASASPGHFCQWAKSCSSPTRRCRPLDVSIKAQVINLMLDLQQSLNLSYLFISHDMAVVERIQPSRRRDVSPERSSRSARAGRFSAIRSTLYEAPPLRGRSGPARKGMRRPLGNGRIKVDPATRL